MDDGTWAEDINIPQDEITHEGEAEHYDDSSLTELETQDGKIYYQYKITIRDAELNDWYHVWETHVNVPGYKLTPSVTTDAEVTGTSNGHKDYAAVLQLTGDTTVTFTNRYEQDELDLTKNVTVSGVEKNEGTTEYTFTLQIPAKWADKSEYNTGVYNVTYSLPEGDQRTAHADRTIEFKIVEGTDYATYTDLKLYAGETAHITLPAGIEVTITEPNHDGYAVNWTVGENQALATNSENSVTVTLNSSVTCTNTTGAVLPSTGGTGVGLYLALGSLLTLGAGLLMIQRRRKEGRDAV